MNKKGVLQFHNGEPVNYGVVISKTLAKEIILQDETTLEVIIGIDDTWKEGSVLYISALNKDSIYFNGTGYISKVFLKC